MVKIRVDEITYLCVTFLLSLLVLTSGLILFAGVLCLGLIVHRCSLSKETPIVLGCLSSCVLRRGVLLSLLGARRVILWFLGGCLAFGLPLTTLIVI